MKPKTSSLSAISFLYKSRILLLIVQGSSFLSISSYNKYTCCYAFSSFQLPKLFQPLFPTATSTTSSSQSKKQKLEVLLLDAVSNTQNGKTATSSQQRNILNLVSKLETEYPSPPLSAILSQEGTRELIDGTWFLQYTSPSEISSFDTTLESEDFMNNEKASVWKVENAEEDITTVKYNAKGSVSAGGINVDVSKKPPKQIFDLSQNTVCNEVDLDYGKVRVGGRFRLSEKKDNRVVVAFQECTIQLKLGITLDLGFLFKIRSMIVGTDESGWLETTYVSDSVRIGRGNKGSMFVLTRSEDDVTP
jgi:hypothetical protein